MKKLLKKFQSALSAVSLLTDSIVEAVEQRKRFNPL